MLCSSRCASRQNGAPRESDMTEHPVSAKEGPNRRDLLVAVAAGAVASTAMDSAALALQPAAAVAVASAADYVRDPTRWGSPEIAALFPGFQHLDMRTKGATIRVRHGGAGSPLLLL